VPHICCGGRGNEANCPPLRHSISPSMYMLDAKPFKRNSSVSRVYCRRRSRHLRRKEKGETLIYIHLQQQSRNVSNQLKSVSTTHAVCYVSCCADALLSPPPVSVNDLWCLGLWLSGVWIYIGMSLFAYDHCFGSSEMKKIVVPKTVLVSFRNKIALRRMCVRWC
jgi:hypothetical protein